VKRLNVFAKYVVMNEFLYLKQTRRHGLS
jgi:hypothetical protein